MPHRFTKPTIHTSDQPGPPSSYVGESRRNAMVSRGTSNFPVGNAQTWVSVKSSPSGGDGLIDAKSRDDKCHADSPCSTQKLVNFGKNQSYSDFGNGHRVGSICH